MNGSPEKGKKMAFAIGIYVMAKALLNGFIGGFSLTDTVLAIAVFGVLFTAVKYCNYIVAAFLAFVVVKHLGHNLSDVRGNLIYLAEAAADIVSAALLIFSRDIRSFFAKGYK